MESGLGDTLRFALRALRLNVTQSTQRVRKEEVCYFLGFITMALSLAYTGKTKLRSVRILTLLNVTDAAWWQEMQEASD